MDIEITVQQVNYTKPGKRWGSIKSSEGEFYGAPDSILGSFSAGEVCRIEYSERKANDGKVWKDLKRKISTIIPPPPAAAMPPRQRTNPADSEQIFVVALLKGMVNHDDNAQTVIQKGRDLKTAYQYLFGSKEKQTTEIEMNDKIEF